MIISDDLTHAHKTLYHHLLLCHTKLSLLAKTKSSCGWGSHLLGSLFSSLASILKLGGTFLVGERGDIILGSQSSPDDPRELILFLDPGVVLDGRGIPDAGVGFDTFRSPDEVRGLVLVSLVGIGLN